MDESGIVFGNCDHPVDTSHTSGTRGVLFVCVENSARSQMAEGFLKDLCPRITVQSAGTAPGATLNPHAVEAMQEIGIDISKQMPKVLTSGMLTDSATLVVNMGCIDKASCPAFLSDCKMEDWQIADPKGQDMKQVRAIRDEIRQKVMDLARTLNR